MIPRQPQHIRLAVERGWSGSGRLQVAGNRPISILNLTLAQPFTVAGGRKQKSAKQGLVQLTRSAFSRCTLSAFSLRSTGHSLKYFSTKTEAEEKLHQQSSFCGTLEIAVFPKFRPELIFPCWREGRFGNMTMLSMMFLHLATLTFAPAIPACLYIFQKVRWCFPFCYLKLSYVKLS